MKKEIIISFLGAVFAAIISLGITLLINYLTLPDAKINQSVFKDKNNNYINTIMIKNTKSNDYLDELKIVVDSDISINSVLINNESIKYDDNSIVVEKIKPKESSIIIIVTDSKIDKDNIVFVSNNQKYDMEYFNDYIFVPAYVIITIISYSILTFIFSVRSDVKRSRMKEEEDKEYNSMKETLKNQEEISDSIKRRLQAQATVHLKEIHDMNIELDFYQKLIINLCNEKISKDDLDNLISKKLKTFKHNKKKVLSYEDAYEMVVAAMEKH